MFPCSDVSSGASSNSVMTSAPFDLEETQRGNLNWLSKCREYFWPLFPACLLIVRKLSPRSKNLRHPRSRWLSDPGLAQLAAKVDLIQAFHRVPESRSGALALSQTCSQETLLQEHLGPRDSGTLSGRVAEGFSARTVTSYRPWLSCSLLLPAL